MRQLSIAEINLLGKGEVIPSVQGTVLEVGKRYTGVSTYGAWSLQKLIITDNQHQIEVLLGQKPPVPDGLKGHTVTISCRQTDRGPMGVSANDDDNKGKGPVKRIVKVANDALVTNSATGQDIFTGAIVHPTPAVQPQPIQPQPIQPPLIPTPPPTVPFTPTPAPKPVTLEGLQPFMDKHASLYHRAVESALVIMKSLEGVHGEGVVSEELFKSAANAIYYAAKDAGYLSVI